MSATIRIQVSRVLAAFLLMTGAGAAAAQGPSPTHPALAPRPASVAGIELLLRGDRADVAHLCLELEAEAIRRRLAARGMGIAEDSTGGGRLNLVVRDPARVGEALAATRAEPACDDRAGGWEIRRAGRRILVHQASAGLDRSVDRAMDSAREVLAHRLAELGLTGASVARQGRDRLLVRAPGLRDATALRPLIGRAPRLEIRLVDTTATALQLARGRVRAGSRILPYPEGGESAHIAVRGEAIIRGDMIADAVQGVDRWDGRPVINISFNQEGRSRFAQATRENLGKPFAIILDDVVITAPNVHEPILGGTAQISGNFTVESARRLATQLRRRPLPIRLAVLAERRF